jgi:peptidyl-prolyl cis-trans isomerase C
MSILKNLKNNTTLKLTQIFDLRALAAIVFFLLVSCTFSDQKISSKPVIQVNGVALSAKNFSSQLANKLKELDALSAKDTSTVNASKQEIISSFISRTLILDWCLSNGLVADEALIEKEVSSIRASYPDDISFRRMLTASGLSFADWKSSIYQSLTESLFFERLGQKIQPPTEVEIKKYYEEHKAIYKRAERVQVRQVVMADEISAEAILADAKKTELAELAKKYSSGPEALNGGLVGWIERGTVDFFEPLFNQSKSKSLLLIKSGFGYHVVRVEKRMPAGYASLDEARPGIIKAIRAQREQGEFVAWLDRQIRSAKILRDDALINSLRIQTRSDSQ